jgi:hypothetical protein
MLPGHSVAAHSVAWALSRRTLSSSGTQSQGNQSLGHSVAGHSVAAPLILLGIYPRNSIIFYTYILIKFVKNISFTLLITLPVNAFPMAEDNYYRIIRSTSGNVVTM